MRWQEATCWTVYYIAIAAAIAFLYFLSTLIGTGAELAITGTSSGTGIHNITISGDWINATLSQAGNASTWNLLAGELA